MRTLKAVNNLAILPFAMVFIILYFPIVILPWFITEGMISAIEHVKKFLD